MNPWPMVRADLRAMRSGAWVTVVILAVTIGIGIAVGAQERALRTASARAADDFPLLVAAPGSSLQTVMTALYLQLEAMPLMDGAVLARLGGDPRVVGAAPLAYGDVVRGYPVVGTTTAFASRFGRVTPTEGRLFERENEAVVGADVAFSLGATVTPSHAVGDRHVPGQEGEFERRHAHEGTSLTVVGRLPRFGSPWDRAILVPVETVWETHGLGNGHTEGVERIGPPFEAETVPGVPVVVVKPRQVFEAYQLRAAYRQGGTTAIFPAEVLVSVYQTLGDLRDVLVVVAAANGVVVFLAVLLLLVTLAGLRRRRYAVLRALGAGRAYVAAVVWLGAATLTVAGAIGGVAVGWAAAQVLSAVVTARTGLVLAPTIGTPEILFAAGLALFGSLAALVPTWAAARRSVASALRG